MLPTDGRCRGKGWVWRGPGHGGGAGKRQGQDELSLTGLLSPPEMSHVGSQIWGRGSKGKLDRVSGTWGVAVETLRGHMSPERGGLRAAGPGRTSMVVPPLAKLSAHRITRLPCRRGSLGWGSCVVSLYAFSGCEVQVC